MSSSERYVIFPWNKNFETGIEKIDKQHKKLVTLLNDLAHTLVEKDYSKINSAFTKLAAYADYHFKEEEEIWHDYFKNDSMNESHQIGHASFLPKINEIKLNRNNDSFVETIEQVIKFLIRWLAYHIIDTDKRMALIVQHIDNGLTLDAAKLAADRSMSGSMRILIETILNMYDTISTKTLDLIREKNARKKIEQEKDELLHILCHDLINPLFRVQSAIDIEKNSPGFLSNNIDILSISVDNCFGIITRVKDWYTPRKESQVLDKVNLSEAIKESLLILADKIKKKNINVEWNCSPQLNISGKKNIVVNSIINNILTNSIKFSQEGGKILISAETKNNTIRMVIRDFGVGIPNAMINDKKIAVRKGTNNEEGSGIGLLLVEKYIELFNGDFELSSHNGTKAVISFKPFVD